MSEKKVDVRQVIRQFAAAKADVFFIQIGSNDGIFGDPLRPYIVSHGWRGILVEPVKYVFDRLVQNYGRCDRLKLENVAISNENGHREFFFLSESSDQLPVWYDQLGSFSRDVIMRHEIAIPDISKRIVRQQVECLTFDALCQRYSIERIDLLHIDAEGYDFEVLKTVELTRYKPLIVLYEHTHLSENDRRLCQRMVELSGYEVFAGQDDSVCLRTDSIVVG